LDRVTADNDSGTISVNVPDNSCQVGQTITIEDSDEGTSSTYEITQVDK
jgi:transcription elongation GreA/GreB family factor